MPQFSYTPHPQYSAGLPLIDIQLANGANHVTASALIDSGAALNLLPFDVGIALGLEWEAQSFPLQLSGMLANSLAFAVILMTTVAESNPVRLAFAWVNRPSTQVRLLLGQVNFFQQYDVHFYGSKQLFEVEPVH